MNNHNNLKRICWIDAVKFIAILAVMVDHTCGILYPATKVLYVSFVSVSLFIVIMGITTFMSLKSCNEPIKKKVLVKSWGIIRPYLIASFIYFLATYKSFDLETYINGVVHFNISGPFYYVLLYIQLMIISPVLYFYLVCLGKKKNSWIKDIIGLPIVIAIAYMTTNFTNILSVYGGGGKLFGGTYLILLYVGMLFAKYYERINIPPKINIVIFIILTAFTIAWAYFISKNTLKIDTELPFGNGINPPSISLCVYAILITLTMYLLEMVINGFNIRVLQKVFSGIAYLGRFTLYIFLFHRLFLDFVIPSISYRTGLVIQAGILKTIVYFACMICGSIFIGSILEKLHHFCAEAFNYTGKKNGIESN